MLLIVSVLTFVAVTLLGFRYRIGSFRQADGGPFGDDWKETPVLEWLGVEYEKPTGIIRHEELREASSSAPPQLHLSGQPSMGTHSAPSAGGLCPR